MTGQLHWYQDAVIYQLHVRAFQDSNDDGVGDFRGLTTRLDYLQELGVTTVWLLPFYPSPLRDDGYDIADYTNIHPSYGTMRDFSRFLSAAHDRGLKVVTELVINHTSDQHEWFQRARRAPPGSPERDFYVWSDTPDKYSEARIIFTDTEPSNWTWDPVAHAYYWHRFFSHQPDLNFDNPAVHDAVLKALDFWLEKGVDGLRLDAVPYLYEREGTMCENLPETHAFLKKLRAHIDANYEDRMLLAEANQWPEDAVAYFGEGDECHMCFHFPLMPRLFMAAKMENRFPVIDILDQTPPIPDSAAWAIFLRNHDELTLEMVTDEERDYMYRVYAEDPQARINLGIRRRLAPLLRNDRRQIELMNALLLSLPGTPVIYYGDEIGMGDNIYLGDRNGVRTPMQWSPDRNAGFSRANPQRLYLPVVTEPEYHYEALNVEAQQANSSSLWWWMKQMIAQRKALAPLAGGDIRFLTPDNPKVLAFERTLGEETVLVVANLSKRTQAVEIDLSHHEGIKPVEIFGQTDFPTVGELPYFLTPGPYQYYWFQLSREELSTYARPRLRLRSEIDNESVFRARTQLGRALATDLPHRRWFRSKAHAIRQVDVVDAIPIGAQGPYLVVATVEYIDQDPETYVLPLALVRGEEADFISNHDPDRVVAEVTGPEDTTALLVDAMGDERVARRLLDLTRHRRRRLRGAKMELSGRGDLAGYDAAETPITVLGTEQSNTSVVFGQDLILKLFRKLEWGENPDIEIGRYLTEQGVFHAIAPVRGVVSGQIDGDSVSVAVVQDYIPNQGDAWSYAVDLVSNFVDQVATIPEGERSGVGKLRHPLELIGSEPPEALADLVNVALPSAGLLGERTGELHRALMSPSEVPAFDPEPMTTLYQRSLYQGMRSGVRESFALLRRRRATLDESTAELASEVLGFESEILDRLRQISTEKVSASRSRIHGDYHLGQVLFTGNDFVIIDFEGEPLRPLSERRIKRSPLRDVAGMIRSYHYAARAGLRKRVEEGVIGRDTNEVASLEPWVDGWFQWTAAAFLEAYLTEVKGTPIVPPEENHVRVMLDAYVLEKAVYELRYELNNRPDWVPIALAGIRLHLV
ncbi:MAG TPA: maltose alpha-D-glucosyltransferase [Acidimicrobiia bacterium]|nr:maltose alpha-D-glucosyltransferase [Acidimicrobiia bacterium]